MAPTDIDAYLAGLDEPARTTLDEVRRRILAVVPECEEGIAYGVPAFRVGGRPVAGLSASAHHLSYLPHSGTVLASMEADLVGYQWSKGALRFPRDAPLPASLVRALVEARLRELGLAPGA